MQTAKTYTNELRKRKVYRLDFDSVGDFSREFQSTGVKLQHNDPSWWGGDSLSTLLKKCTEGETTHVQAAEDLLEQLRHEIEVPKPQWSPSPFGAFPMVPEFLAGDIECMRIMQHDPQQSTPIRIWFDPTSSAVIDAKDLVKRGTAVLALTMALSQIRPVELWTFCDLDAHGKDHSLICVKIQTAPMMLSEACYVLCNPGYARALTYSMAHQRFGFQGMWGFGDWCDDESRIEIMKASLQASDQDIIIPGASYKDDLITNPIEYIRREIKRHTNQLEEAY